MNKTIQLIIITVFLCSLIYVGVMSYLTPSKKIEPGKFEVIESTLPIAASRYKKNYQAPKGRYAIQNIIHSSIQRTYHVYEGTKNKDKPIIVLLHGSQRNGAAMLDMWQGVARKNDLLLLAPDSADKRGWSLKNDPLSFLNSIIEDARKVYGFTSKEVYLFGHSSGARQATFISVMKNNPFKAVGTHAGYPKKENLKIVLQSASVSKVPIVFFLGTDDHIFSVEGARQSAETLVQAGQDVKLSLFKKHNHWYYTVAPYVNQRAWDFFSHKSEQTNSAN